MIETQQPFKLIQHFCFSFIDADKKSIGYFYANSQSYKLVFLNYLNLVRH